MYIYKILINKEIIFDKKILLLMLSLNIIPFFISFGNKPSLFNLRIDTDSSITRATTYEIANFINKNTIESDLVVSYNYNGWSSELAYYSDRKFIIPFNYEILNRFISYDASKLNQAKFLLLCNCDDIKIKNFEIIKTFTNNLNYCNLLSNTLLSSANNE